LNDVEASDGFLRRAERAGRLLENTVLAVIVAAMVLLAAGQIALRNLTGAGFPWADEGLRLLVLWVAMVGAVAASNDDRHIAIDVLSRFLSETGKLWAAVVVDLFTATVSFVLAWYAFEFVADSREFGDQLLGTLPAWWFQAVMPVAFFLIGYRYTIWFLRRVWGSLGRGTRA